MFNNKVNTNKVSPKAKATNVSGELNSVSPVNWLTIFTVMVVIASNGLIDNLAEAPALAQQS